jgi:hypothetical protein
MLMKLIICTLASFALVPINSLNQISVDSGDGSSVKIGPSGIQVITPDAKIHVNSGGEKVQTKKSYASSRSVSSHASRTAHTTIKKQTVSTSANTTFSLQEQVVKLELLTYGKGQSGLSLLGRVEKLELDTFGARGAGTLKARILLLKKALESGQKTTVKTNTVVHQEVNVESQSRLSTAPKVLVVANTGEDVKYTLNGGSVEVSGTGCTVRLIGKCDSLEISGTGNDVITDYVKSVSLTGTGNTVTWLPQCQPQVTQRGTGNEAKARD